MPRRSPRNGAHAPALERRRAVRSDQADDAKLGKQEVEIALLRTFLGRPPRGGHRRRVWALGGPGGHQRHLRTSGGVTSRHQGKENEGADGQHIGHGSQPLPKAYRGPIMQHRLFHLPKERLNGVTVRTTLCAQKVAVPRRSCQEVCRPRGAAGGGRSRPPDGDHHVRRHRRRRSPRAGVPAQPERAGVERGARCSAMNVYSRLVSRLFSKM